MTSHYSYAIDEKGSELYYDMISAEALQGWRETSAWCHEFMIENVSKRQLLMRNDYFEVRRYHAEDPTQVGSSSLALFLHNDHRKKKNVGSISRRYCRVP